MLDEGTACELLVGVRSLASLRDVRAVEDRWLGTKSAKSRDLIAAIRAATTVEGRELELRVGLSAAFPSELPHVFVEDVEDLGFLPHVDPNTGWVCYTSREGLSVSLRRPECVLHIGVDRALEVLGDGIAGRNHGDTADEIEAYWREFARVSTVPSYIAPSGQPRVVTVGCVKGEIIYVADNFEQVQSADPTARRAAETRYAPYIPLPRSATEAIKDPRAFLQPGALRAFVEAHIDPSARTQLEQKLKAKHFPLVVLGLSRSDGVRSLVAVRFPRARSHPLVSRKPGGGGKLLPLGRRDRSSLRARGGASNELGTMRIAVLGCGSIGGYVATMLAKTGVGKLVLIDHDKLEYENLFRHVLGANDVGRPKVEALKNRLESAVPYLSVTAIDGHARPAIARGEVDDVHLAVVAIGNPTENRLINGLLHKADIPAVYTWLEPLGIGGHALLALGGSGCYECLFVDESGHEQLAARSDFAAPDQRFARDITGCAAAFTPYGDIDARRTANLATRLAVDALLERAARSTLCSWKGDPREFENAGFKLSARFGQDANDLDSHRHDFPQQLCPVCAGQT